MTSLFTHNNKETLGTSDHVFLRTSYYGSIGRPDRSAHRKSAVELLEESKAYYVKSESVLDAKQELKNAEHLSVRSPTCNRPPETVSTLPRGSHHCSASLYPHSICPTCSPYSYTNAQDHLTRFQLMTLQEHYAQEYERLQRENINSGYGSIQVQIRRASVPSPPSFPIPFQMERNSINHSPASFFAPIKNNKNNGTNKTSKKSSETHLKNSVANSPPRTTIIPTSSSNNNGVRKLEESHGPSSKEVSPPPLPPKSPRSKPTRPHNFPVRLPPPPDMLLPPPPPIQSKTNPRARRGRGHVIEKTPLKLPPKENNPIPLTLPSPILPPSPPAHIVLHSPMSDSGPIISPPPAFSTPVTPMLDRTNSGSSKSSGDGKGGGVGGSGRGGGREGVLKGRMRELSSSESSPLSESSSESERRDSSSPPVGAQGRRNKTLPKSVTEATLSRLTKNIPSDNIFKSAQSRFYANYSTLQIHGSQRTKEPPPRRPILRSKSDLSHRYKKSGHSSLLTGGLTLVQVDLSTTSSPDPRRLSRSSVELENFFDGLGGINDTLPRNPPFKMCSSQGDGLNAAHESPIFFSSMSSVESAPHRGSVESGDSPIVNQRNNFGARSFNNIGTTNNGPSVSPNNLVITHGEPSIVERNARVIKWLFNCRKAVESRGKRL